MLRRTPIVLLAAAALAGCKNQSSAAQAQPAAAPSTAAAATEDPVAAMKAAEQDMLQGYATHDADRVARNYAPDARLMSGGEVVEGHDAIARVLKQYLAFPSFSNDYKAERAYATGDLGYVRGRFHSEAVVREGTRPVVSDGDYVTVYRRQPDGKWRVVEDINVDSKPAAR